jgi:hypothetical protein
MRQKQKKIETVSISMTGMKTAFFFTVLRHGAVKTTHFSGSDFCI